MATLQIEGETDEDYINRFEMENPDIVYFLKGLHSRGEILEGSEYLANPSVYRELAALDCYHDCEGALGGPPCGFVLGGVSIIPRV